MTGQVDHLGEGRVGSPKFGAPVVNFIAGSIKPLRFMTHS